MGQVIWDAFPEAVGTESQRAYEHVAKTGETVRFMQYYPPLAKRFEISAFGTPDGVAIYFRDVTEEHKREEQLRMLENAVSRLKEMVMISREDKAAKQPSAAIIAYVNDAFCERLGYRRDDVIGKSTALLIGPASDESALQYLGNTLQTKVTASAEIIIYTAQGHDFWAEVSVAPAPDEADGTRRWVTVLRDITKKRAAEEAIRISEERFRLVSRATNEVIWDWDFNAGSIWWNESFQTVYGYDPATFRDINSWATCVHPDDRDRVMESLHTAIDGQDEVWSGSYRIICADKTERYIADRGFIIRNKEGRAVRFIGSNRDITEQRRLNEQLFQSQSWRLSDI